jgi:NAD(P)-dependent dehydrogenase (short-subunit alcohol dehydrogenase family)
LRCIAPPFGGALVLSALARVSAFADWGDGGVFPSKREIKVIGSSYGRTRGARQYRRSGHALPSRCFFVRSILKFAKLAAPSEHKTALPCIGGLETSNEIWRQVMDVNLMAHVYAARALVPRMVARGGGYFLNTASAATQG